MPDTLTPITREETYLAAIAGEDVTPPDPICRKEEFLDAIDDHIGDVETDVTELQTQVPASAALDEGKVLTATATAGTAAWANVPKELPASLGTAGQVLTVNAGATGVEWKTPSGENLQAFTIYATGEAQVNSGNILVPTNLTSQVQSTLFDSDTGRQLAPVFIAMPDFSGTSPYYTYENGTTFYLESALGITTHDIGSYNVTVVVNPSTGIGYLQAMHK